MKHNKKFNKKGSFYIALCGCAVTIAVASYVGNIIKTNNENEELALKESAKKNSYVDEIVIDDVIDTDDDTNDNEFIDETPVKPQENTTEIIDEEPIDSAPASRDEEIDEFIPNLPVPGKICADYSGDNLIYYEKLGEWKTHSGIDIEASVGDDVYICEDGVVERVYSNNFGRCVLVDHRNGYKSLYANLSEEDVVNVGDELGMGETIGRVGEPSVGDLYPTAHVHFEILSDGKTVNPIDMIPVE